MDEYRLIEIAKRFRALEDAATHIVNDYWNEVGAPKTGRTETQLESALESCRDDMTAMQEALRKCGGVK